MIRRPILERIDCWYLYATRVGIPLTRILVHPEDFYAAPLSYEGLPVVSMTPELNRGRGQSQKRVDS